MVVLGRIAAPHGVRGWVSVRAFGDDPAAWRDMQCWWLSEGAAWVPYRLAEMRFRNGRLVTRFEGIEDREAAASLTGRWVAAPRESLPRTGRDEYYWADLIGLQVVTASGTPIGSVTRLIDSSAHPVLSVTDEAGSERLLPFVAQVIRRVDLAGRTIVADWNPDW
jgi:16S rRNA processing protein RimM